MSQITSKLQHKTASKLIEGKISERCNGIFDHGFASSTELRHVDCSFDVCRYFNFGLQRNGRYVCTHNHQLDSGLLFEFQAFDCFTWKKRKMETKKS